MKVDKKEELTVDQIVVLAKIFSTILCFGCGRVWIDLEILYYFYKEIGKITSPKNGFFETIHIMWKLLEKMDLVSFNSAGNYIVIGVGKKGRIYNPREMGYDIIYFRYKEQASWWRDLIIEQIKIRAIKESRKALKRGELPPPIVVPKITIAKTY